MGKKPRIIIDALAFAPHDGGFTTLIANLLDTCSALGEFEFFVAHHKGYTSTFAKWPLPGLKVEFPAKARFFVSALILPYLVRSVRATAVHCEISAVPRFLGVPSSVTVTDLYFLIDRTASGRGVKHWIMQLYWERYFARSLQRAEVIKAISQTTADDVRRLVSPSLSPVVIHPFANAAHSVVAKRSWPADGEPVRLLFLGSIVPRKNLLFLLRALPAFKVNWLLDVVGNPWWGFAEIAPLLVSPRIRYHGHVSNEERDRLLLECHIIIVPSLYEGFSYPTIEAIGRGCLALTSNVSVFREYVPEQCRFDLNDPQNLADLFNRLDQQTYALLRELSSKCIARFSREAHIEGHRIMFRRLLNEGEHGRSDLVRKTGLSSARNVT